MPTAILDSKQALDQLQALCAERFEAQTQKILVCAGTGCIAGGALDVYEKLKVLMEEKNVPPKLLPAIIRLEEMPVFPILARVAIPINMGHTGPQASPIKMVSASANPA